MSKKTREEEVAEQMAGAVNGMGFNYKACTDALGKEHRTLQQNFTKLCFAWIQHMAEVKEHDLRNEASVKACKKIMTGVDKYDLMLPFI